MVLSSKRRAAHITNVQAFHCHNIWQITNVTGNYLSPISNITARNHRPQKLKKTVSCLNDDRDLIPWDVILTIMIIIVTVMTFLLINFIFIEHSGSLGLCILSVYSTSTWKNYTFQEPIDLSLI